MTWVDKKEELRELIVEQRLSYQEIGRMFNVTGEAVKRAAQRLGIPLIPRRKINPNETFGRGTAKMDTCLNCGKEFILYLSHTGKYCCHSCQVEYQRKRRIEDWKAGRISGTCCFSCSDLVRNYMFEKAGYK